MSNEPKEKALPAIESLKGKTEDQLYAQLGMRDKAIEKDPSKGESYNPTVIFDGTTMGLKDDIVDFGKQLFKTYQLQAYNLACGADKSNDSDRKDLMNAFGLGDATFAAAIATVLVAQVGIAPAIASVVGVLVIKLFFRPTYEQFCKAWSKSVKGASTS